MSRIDVVICVYRHDLIDVLLDDLLQERDLVRIVIIDNSGNYNCLHSDVEVLRPGNNLKWLKGSNFGLRYLIDDECFGYLLLNDDVRLSRNFIVNIIQSYEDIGDAVIGPVYDDVWPQQKNGYNGPAIAYVPRNIYREVKFIDGTAMFIPKVVLKTVGFLDEDNFGDIGWGADFDYCLRAKSAGFPVYVTERCFLNHYRSSTADLFAGWREQAAADMNTGMVRRWGTGWQQLLGI